MRREIQALCPHHPQNHPDSLPWLPAGATTLRSVLCALGLSVRRAGLPRHFPLMSNVANDEGESVNDGKRWNIQMCFFCSGNLKYGSNFPEGLLSLLRLRLVIEKAPVSLTDPSLQSGKGGGGSGEADRQDSRVRMVASEKPPSTCVRVWTVGWTPGYIGVLSPSKTAHLEERIPSQLNFHFTPHAGVKGCGHWPAGSWQLSAGISQRWQRDCL